MIHEFAIDPAAVIECAKETSWVQLFICDKLKQGSPAVFSELTGHGDWKRRVLERKDELTQQQKIKMDELIKLCKERSVKRSSRRPAYNYSETQTWPENAIEEDRNYPYRGIIVGERGCPPGNVIQFADLPVAQSFTDLKREVSISREHSEIAKAVAPLLRCAQDITIVDPYFTPFVRTPKGKIPDGSSRGERFKATLNSFFKEMEARDHPRRPCAPPKKIEILTGLLGEWREHEGGNGSSWKQTLDSFPFSCRALYEELIPYSWEVTFTVLQEQKKKEELHDRFIITELASLSIFRGHDHSPKKGPKLRISLNSDNHSDLWYAYKSQSPARVGEQQGDFKVTQTCTVSGKAPIE